MSSAVSNPNPRSRGRPRKYPEQVRIPVVSDKVMSINELHDLYDDQIKRVKGENAIEIDARCNSTLNVLMVMRYIAEVFSDKHGVALRGDKLRNCTCSIVVSEVYAFEMLKVLLSTIAIRLFTVLYVDGTTDDDTEHSMDFPANLTWLRGRPDGFDKIRIRNETHKDFVFDGEDDINEVVRHVDYWLLTPVNRTRTTLTFRVPLDTSEFTELATRKHVQYRVRYLYSEIIRLLVSWDYWGRIAVELHGERRAEDELGCLTLLSSVQFAVNACSHIGTLHCKVEFKPGTGNVVGNGAYHGDYIDWLEAVVGDPKQPRVKHLFIEIQDNNLAGNVDIMFAHPYRAISPEFIEKFRYSRLYTFRVSYTYNIFEGLVLVALQIPVCRDRTVDSNNKRIYAETLLNTFNKWSGDASLPRMDFALDVTGIIMPDIIYDTFVTMKRTVLDMDILKRPYVEVSNAEWITCMRQILEYHPIYRVAKRDFVKRERPIQGADGAMAAWATQVENHIAGAVIPNSVEDMINRINAAFDVTWDQAYGGPERAVLIVYANLFRIAFPTEDQQEYAQLRGNTSPLTVSLYQAYRGTGLTADRDGVFAADVSALYRLLTHHSYGRLLTEMLGYPIESFVMVRQLEPTRTLTANRRMTDRFFRRDMLRIDRQIPMHMYAALKNMDRDVLKHLNQAIGNSNDMFTYAEYDETMKRYVAGDAKDEIAGLDAEMAIAPTTPTNTMLLALWRNVKGNTTEAYEVDLQDRINRIDKYIKEGTPNIEGMNKRAIKQKLMYILQMEKWMLQVAKYLGRVEMHGFKVSPYLE